MTPMKKITLAFLLLAAAVPVRADDPAPKTILFLGDTFVAGYGVTPSETMPAQIADRVAAAGLPFTVINAGESGEDSAAALQRAQELFQQHHVDVLVLFVGANDGLRQASISDLEHNLVYIIYRARKSNPRMRILFLGVRMPAEMGAYARRFNEIYPRIAYRRRIAILPWVLEGIMGELDLTLADHMHPNERGFKLMADRVWPGLESILRKSMADPPPKPKK